MSNSQYNAALTIFFVSYSVFEPLTNVLLKRLRPSIFIPIIMVLWVRYYPRISLSHTDIRFKGSLHDVHGLCPQLGRSDGCSSSLLSAVAY